MSSSATDGQAGGEPQSSIRLYTNRASYHLPAALEIFRQSPISHVAFLHPGDIDAADVKGKKREETVMNLPLILVVVMDGEEEDDESSYSVYLHTYARSFSDIHLPDFLDIAILV
jgi:hypothetical protein